MTDHYLCVHGHFYQPPRGNPFDEDAIGVEPGADPYQNYNEKIAAECYTPNASLGNFEMISFSLGASLAHWLSQHAPETYQQIVASCRAHVDRWGMSNAMAPVAHPAILPLSSARDKALQIRWGLLSFEHHFGHRPEGLWLPEMAVDLETLQLLHDNGVKFTVLSQSQVRDANAGAGPYWVKLPSGSRLAVFVRDDYHSNQLAFNIANLGGAGRWARNTLGPLRRDYAGRLLLLATNGETFGHHHAGEEHFLHWLLRYEAGAIGFEVITLARALSEWPPAAEVEIIENTSWSCAHGLARWSTGCECTPGDVRWKGVLRRALENLAHQVDEAYLESAVSLKVEPWALRIKYYQVLIGQTTLEELLREAGLSEPDSDSPRVLALHTLLRAQYYRQRMFVSTTFFFEDIDRPEPRYGIANAVRAGQLVADATGRDLLASLRRDLSLAVSPRTLRTGAQILDDVLAEARQKEAA